MFDCTAPHQYIPSDEDNVINVYENACNIDVLSLNREELISIEKGYKNLTSASRGHLAKAHDLYREIHPAVLDENIIYLDMVDLIRNIESIIKL